MPAVACTRLTVGLDLTVPPGSEVVVNSWAELVGLTRIERSCVSCCPLVSATRTVNEDVAGLQSPFLRLRQ